MSALIHPTTVTVDGLSIRYAESGPDRHDAILLSPWPESVYAFEQGWPQLAADRAPPGRRSSGLRRLRIPPSADEPEGNGAFHP